jgi:hypothetical protein
MSDGLSAAMERRIWTRRPCMASDLLPVVASFGQEHWQAPVRDISTAGMGILLDHRVDPGSVLAIELLNKFHQFWHLKLLRVIHATPQDGHGWLVGSAFLKSFTDDEFQALFE